MTVEVIESTEGDTAEAPKTTFAELGLSETLLGTLTEIGFLFPTDVQAQSIPPALEGRDLLVQSRTGSGKTAAFGIPIGDGLLDPGLLRPQALILAPTRELAVQVEKECSRLLAHAPVNSVAIYGGAAMGPQVKALEDGAQLVVGTPGRVLDHMRRGTLATDQIRVFVLDEADEMLSMGFWEEITAIVEALPKERQNMLFSATIPQEIEGIAEQHLRDPVRLYLSEDFVGVREIDHVYYMVTGGNKTSDLLQVLAYEQPELALVFCNTREETARVAEFLTAAGFASEGISSDLSQRDRERVMTRMRAGELKYLVATDIAARGIDIADVTHVVNYSFPDSPDVYVHRTGRTGRAGRSGVAVSLVTPREIGSFYYLKLIHRIYPEERHLPTAEELATRKEAQLLQDIRSRYGDKQPSPLMLSLAQRMWSAIDGHRLLALTLEELNTTVEGPLNKPIAPPRPERKRSRSRREESADDDRPKRRRNGRDRDERRERDDRGRERDRDDRRRRDRNGGKRRDDRDPREARERHEPVEGQHESFTTSDGDIEYYEAVELPGGNSRSAESPGTGESSSGGESPGDDASTDAMVRLYVNVGRRHNVRAEELTSFLQVEGELDADEIGTLDAKDRHSYVMVKSDAADKLIGVIDGKTFREREIRIERAKPAPAPRRRR